MVRFLIVFLICLQGGFCEEVWIRSFDLGGGGLKTALLSYDPDSKQMRYLEPEVQLGKCPADQEVKEWIRLAMEEKLFRDLDEEVEEGVLFAFSLADLSKLKDRSLLTREISELCDLPKERVVSLDDGAAHLFGSLYALQDELPEGPIWNFGIGTGVCVSYIDASRKLNTPYELSEKLGALPCDIEDPITGKLIGRACNRTCFEKIVQANEGDLEKSFSQFAAIWKPYLEVVIFHEQLEPPVAIVFTGGHTELYKGGLVEALSKLEIPVSLFTGPSQAGLLGAAFYAIQVFGEERVF